MFNFWELEESEKNAWIENALIESKKIDSLSNDVVIFDNLIIKIIKNDSSIKRNNEIMILDRLGRRYYAFNKYLVIEYIAGKIKNIDDKLSKSEVEYLIQAKEALVKIDDTDIKYFDIGKKINYYTDKINEYLCENDLKEIDLKKIIDYLSMKDDWVLSHCDLNNKNIIHSDKFVTLIDFEEVAICHKSFDWATFIIGRNLNNDELDFLSKKILINKGMLIDVSIIQGIMMFFWNVNMNRIHNDEKYVVESQRIAKRINYLYKLKIK